MTLDHHVDRVLWEFAVEAAGVGVFDWDLVTGVMTWDDRLLELFGYDRASFGGSLDDFMTRVHPADRADVSAALRNAIDTCGTYEAEYRIVVPCTGRGSADDAEPDHAEPDDAEPDGDVVRWVGARGRAVGDASGHPVRLIGAAYDTTAHREAVRAARRVTLLAEVTSALASAPDAETGLARLAQLFVPELADWCVVSLAEGIDDGGDWRRGLRDVASWHVDERARPLVRHYAELRRFALTDTSYVVEALRTGRSATVTIDLHGSGIEGDGGTVAVGNLLIPGPARDLLVKLAPRWAGVFPLRGRRRVMGLISLFNGPDRARPTGDDLDTMTELADRAGLALDNARLYASQQRVAEELQRSLLTEPPQPENVQIVVRYTAATEAAQIGGDWYDAFLQPDGATVIVIGDVVGHDTAAAAAMGQLRGLLRGIAVYSGLGPAEVLAGVDRVMQTLQVDTTATAVVARIEQDDAQRDRGGATIRWSNAGHPPPLVLSKEGRIAVLDAAEADLLLGVDPSEERTESAVVLERGTTVFFYTDGLVERRSQPLEEGMRRLRSTFAELSGHTLDDLCDAVLKQLLPASPDDDVALVAIRLHPRNRPRPPDAGPRRIRPDVPDTPEVDPESP